MAKGQLRGNREQKKPKQAKKAPTSPSSFLSQTKAGAPKQGGKK